MSALLYPVHLFLVDLATGLPLLGLWLEWAGRKDEAVWKANRKLIHIAWICLLGGALIGTLQGILVWNDEWSRKVQLAGSRIGFAGVEFLTSLGFLLIYAFLLQKKQAYRSIAWHWLRWLVLLIASTNLLYHFPVLFGALRQMDVSHYVGQEVLAASEFRELIFSLPVISGWIHFTVSSIAISSIVAWMFCLRLATDAERTRHRLAWISFIATSSQWVIGPAVFVNLSRTTQIQLTGANPLWTAWMAQALIMAIALTAIQFQLVVRPTWKTAWTVLGLQAYLVFAMSLVENTWL